MKKYLLTAVCIIMMSMTASGLTINKALLDHNGIVTLFDGDKIQDAIDAAEDGDVIYLTLGMFKPFNVTKGITIKGTGEKSVIDGDVKISIPNSSTLNNSVLEAFVVLGSVTVTDPLANLTVSQCKVTSSFDIGANVNKGTIERCQIGSMPVSGAIQELTIDRSRIGSGFVLSSTIGSMTLTNTFLSGFSASYGAANNTTIVNCNLYFSSCTNFSGTIINSIVGPNGYGMQLHSTVLVNSIIKTYHPSSSGGNYSMSIGTNCVQHNCYTVSSSNFDTSTTALQANGYLGNDGTVVGIHGGNTPYDDNNMFVPSVPKVTSSEIKLDNEKKELNVKLTVSPQ